MPSPQLLSRGNFARSSSKTSTPAFASTNAAAAPAGPAPATTTSAASKDCSDLGKQRGDLVASVIKMRCDANAGFRPVVYHETAGDEFAAGALRIWKIHRDMSTSCRRILG